MTAPPPPARRRPPAPLVVAASLTAVEALVAVVLSLAELATLDDRRLVMGLSTAVFFLVCGVGLLLCAWALQRLRSWARAPVVVAQLTLLYLAWDFWGGATEVVSVALAVTGVVVLAGLLHPQSIDALAEDSDERV